MDVSQHLAAVEGRAFRQQGVEDAHQLAADGNDGLLLLQRVLLPRRVIHVQAVERVVRCQERYHTGEEQPPQAGTSALADGGLALVLAGAVLPQGKARQLHNLFRRIETLDVACFGKEAGYRDKADALDGQQVLALRDLFAQVSELVVDLLVLFAQKLPFVKEHLHLHAGSSGTFCLSRAPRRSGDQALGLLPADCAQLHRTPEFDDAVGSQLEDVFRQARGLQQGDAALRGKAAIGLRVLRKIDFEPPRDAVAELDFRIHNALAQEPHVTEFCVDAARDVRNAVPSFHHEPRDDLRILAVALGLVVVVEFLGPAHMQRVHEDELDASLVQEPPEAEPVVAGRLSADDDLVHVVRGLQALHPIQEELVAAPAIHEPKDAVNLAASVVERTRILLRAANVNADNQSLLRDLLDLVILCILLHRGTPHM